MKTNNIDWKKATIEFKDAGEMLWVMLANVSGGDWKKQTKEWQKYTKKWVRNYHRICSKYKIITLRSEGRVVKKK